VSIRAVEQGERILKVSIRDDGVGFDYNTTDHGIGLLGMRERVRGLGGTLEILASAGAGTTIHIALPIERSTKPV
jgi:signal transduction histidine kinase